jgi:hypothetical protein
MKLPLFSLRASTRVLIATSALFVFSPALAFAPGAQAAEPRPAPAAPESVPSTTAVYRPGVEELGQRCDAVATRVAGATACREAAFGYLTAKGLTPDQAAGVVGNLWLESSGVSPKSKQFGGGPGRGIAQWTVTERWQGVLAFARSRGVSPESLQVQLDYLWHELNTTYKKALVAIRSARDLRDATLAFQNKFEVPIGTNIGGPPYEFNAHRHAHTADRVRYAKHVRQSRSARWFAKGR